MKTALNTLGLFVLFGAAGKNDAGGDLSGVLIQIIVSGMIFLAAWLWDNPKIDRKEKAAGATKSKNNRHCATQRERSQ